MSKLTHMIIGLNWIRHN